MSRCFPYPPPGYDRKNGARDESLIELMKLQREREKANKERREEKKREKEEKKEKKRKARENGEIEGKKHRHEKRHKNERSKVDKKGEEHRKRKEDEAEQLEKSSLTEEHGQPSIPQSLYDSSDSTQNSNKRKKNSLPSDNIHNHGSILRIRLPLLKHKDQQPCSTSGRTHIIAQGKYENAPRLSKEQHCSSSGRTDIAVLDKDPRPSEEQPCSISGRTDIVALEKAETAPRSTFLKRESRFRDLFENWVPLPIQSERTDFDDQEWLFETKQPHGQESKRYKPSNDGLCQGSSNLWPQACYLPEADIYALPYTVPF